MDLGAEPTRIKRIESPLSDRQRATCSYRRNEEVSRKDTFVRFNVSPVMLGEGETKGQLAKATHAWLTKYRQTQLCPMIIRYFLKKIKEGFTSL